MGWIDAAPRGRSALPVFILGPANAKAIHPLVSAEGIHLVPSPAGGETVFIRERDMMLSMPTARRRH